MKDLVAPVHARQAMSDNVVRCDSERVRAKKAVPYIVEETGIEMHGRCLVDYQNVGCVKLFSQVFSRILGLARKAVKFIVSRSAGCLRDF